MSVSDVLLESDDLFGDCPSGTVYDKAPEISRYLLMHYGAVGDTFDRPDHPLANVHDFPGRLSAILEVAACCTGTLVRSALDVGCNVGGATHAMSSWVRERVVGIDLSERSIEIARCLTDHRGGTFSIAELGPFTRQVRFRLPDPRQRARVEFRVGDACALDGSDGGHDAVLLSNVLDRVADPAGCLRQFTDSTQVLRDGGLLMIACPWSWCSEFSHPGHWLGSVDGSTTSEQAVKELLHRDFELVVERNEPAVLRRNPREYDYLEAHVTVWKRR